MASIRKRAPWRVVTDGEDDPHGPSTSLKQAEARKATLVAQGVDEKSINVVQAREGAWEARVRRQGSALAWSLDVPIHAVIRPTNFISDPRRLIDAG